MKNSIYNIWNKFKNFFKCFHSHRKAVLTWVEIIAILSAGVWALINFADKKNNEFPSLVLNVEMSRLETKKVFVNQVEKQLIPIKIVVKMKNPSSRKLFLFQNYW